MLFLKQIQPLKKFILLHLLLLSFFVSSSQYWQQQVNHTIDVKLNTADHSLDAFQRIEYINNSPDTLHFIWFHVWPNAYKNDQTAFSDQYLENNSTDFYFSDDEDRGYINRMDFKVDNVTATVEDHPQHIDIIKIILPRPLPPAARVFITTPFHVKLPAVWSRSGQRNGRYQVTQWYPKPAVYDQEGWHTQPYLDQGEFYNEFGDYDVTITVPANLVVAATGELKDENELNWLRSLNSTRDTNRAGIKSIRYVQNNATDFAWFADKNYQVSHEVMDNIEGRKIDLFSFYSPASAEFWKNTTSFIQDAIVKREEWIGAYPYSVATAVEGATESGGGMEYPTITVIGKGNNERMLEFTIVHEVSHNWFQAVLASNERAYPWLDEGFNTYYDNRHTTWKHSGDGEISIGADKISLQNAEKLFFDSRAAVKLDQPINTKSEDFNLVNYALVAYYKTGAWLELMEKELGTETFDRVMKTYYERWKFKHPKPEDFFAIAEEVSGKQLDHLFALTNEQGSLPGDQPKGLTFIPPFSIKKIAEYVIKPTRDLIWISPLVGFNSYDKLMLGAAISNMKLPPSKFQFLLVPLYAFGSKEFNGIGRLSYSIFPEKTFRKIELFGSGSAFSYDQFTKEDGDKVITGFEKLSVGSRLTIKPKHPGKFVLTYIQFKTFFFNEGSFRIRYDSIFSPPDTFINQVVTTRKENRNLNQLKFAIENYRLLYPYSLDLTIDQGKDFIRAGFTGNYFFNYPKEGGLHLRLFAGKFIYLGEKNFTKQFLTDRYHLNMTGPNGYEDYTYSDYFVGRNKFQGLASQQTMNRDGNFKVRTDLYADKVGKTDDWLAAINLTTTIPSAINPLSILPVKIPLKAFLDIGTYAEAWDRDENLDRFVYDGGLQLSLFGDVLNIYVPLIYSPIYKEYIQSIIGKPGRLKKTISFSFDLSSFNQKQINRVLSF